MAPDKMNKYTVQHVAALSGYLLCVCVVFWNVVKSPFTNIVGMAHLHVWEELWHFWWTATALTTGQSPFYSTMLGFPSGMNVFYDMSSISLPMISVPLQALFGVVGAYNVIAFLSLTAASFGAYLVCHRISGAPLASFLGGVVFGLSPFLQTELSNGMLENVFAFAFLPYFVLCLLRIHARGRWTDGLAAGLIAGFAALSSWYFVVACVFLAPLFFYAAYYNTAMDDHSTIPELRRRLLTAYAVMATVICVLIIIPLATLTSGPTLQRGVPWRDCVEGPLMQKSCIDVLKLFTHGSTPPSEPSVAATDDFAPELLPFGVYLGKLVLLLVLLALWMRDPEHENSNDSTPPRSALRLPRPALWKTSFLLFLLLMLGPYLNVGGRVDWGAVRIPLLNRLLLLLPGTGRMMALHNYRFVSCGMLFAAILTALSMKRILSKWTGTRLRLILVGLTTWLVFVDFGSSTAREHMLFLPVSDATLPTGYESMAQDPSGAIFNIPVSSGAHCRPDIRGVQMFHQLAHHRPIPCAPIYILDPPENETSLARAARAMAMEQTWKLDGHALDHDLRLLKASGFRFVVIHRRFLSDNDYARIFTLMQNQLGNPLRPGQEIVIFRLTPAAQW